MIDRIVVPPLDLLALDSIFETQGRNDACRCSSGQKYKRCCDLLDQAAWRFVMQRLRQADAACAFLRTLPLTGRSFDPREED